LRTRLSTKGQLIIPKAMRERLGWSAGDELVLDERGDSIVIRAARPGAAISFEDLVGCAGYRGSARSVDEMEKAIAQGAREQGGHRRQ
jgi:AbrB family looped-hinge helix DNA binding protein